MNRSRRRRRPGGFTLIEVLLVLVILVILASFGTVSIFNAQKKAKADAARAQIGPLKTAIEMYQLNMNQPPENLEQLMVSPGDPRWTGPYLDKLPLDPWGNQYQYQPMGPHNPETFDIWTVSPEGIEIGNWEAVR